MVQSVLSILEKAGRPLPFQEIVENTSYAKGSLTTTLYLLQKLTGSVKIIQHDQRKFKDVDSIYKYPSVKKWLSELKEGDYVKGSKYTFFDYVRYFRKQAKFKDPEDLIDAALNASPKQLQEHVSLIKDFLFETQKNVAFNTKLKRKNVLCSFYLHNGVTLPRFSLPKEANGKEDTEVPSQAASSISMLVMLRKVLLSAKLSARDKAVILIASQAFMDDSTLTKSFNHVGYSQLCAHFGTRNWREWNPNKVPVRLNLRRPKNGKAFYTFIDHDAVQALLEWLAVRFQLTGKEIQIYESRRSDRVPLSDPVFPGLRPAYVSDIFRQAGFAAGVNQRPTFKIEKWRGSIIRHPFHSHEVRDMGKTLSHHLGLKDECEFFLGHEIDKLKYDKHPDQFPDYWREFYSKLAPFLNFLSNDPEKVNLEQKLERANEEKTKAETQLFVRNKLLEEKLNEERTKRENIELQQEAMMRYLQRPTEKPLSYFLEEVRNERTRIRES